MSKKEGLESKRQSKYKRKYKKLEQQPNKRNLNET